MVLAACRYNCCLKSRFYSYGKQSLDDRLVRRAVFLSLILKFISASADFINKLRMS